MWRAKALVRNAPALLNLQRDRRLLSEKADTRTRQQIINADILDFAKWLGPLAILCGVVMYVVPETTTLGEMLGQPVKPEPGFEPERYPQLNSDAYKQALKAHMEAQKKQR